jgi:hypothetical protein
MAILYELKRNACTGHICVSARKSMAYYQLLDFWTDVFNSTQRQRETLLKGHFAKYLLQDSGTRFKSVDAVKAKATQLLKSITQDDLQHCFLERRRDRGGDYTEGDNISIVWFVFNKGLEHESGFFIAGPATTSVFMYNSDAIKTEI